MCSALFNRADFDSLSGGAGVLYRDDGVGSGGHGRARHNAAGLTGANRFLRHFAGRYVFDNIQGYGRIVLRGGCVRMTHGIAVHGRIVAGWIVAPRQHVLGEYAARRVEQRNALGAEDFHVFEDDGAGFFRGEHRVGGHIGYL